MHIALSVMCGDTSVFRINMSTEVMLGGTQGMTQSTGRNPECIWLIYIILDLVNTLY